MRVADRLPDFTDAEGPSLPRSDSDLYAALQLLMDFVAETDTVGARR